jgi:uncharacterized repeat protein (TIGR01451 family)
VNVNRCSSGTNLRKAGIFLAGAVLLAAGCLLLGLESRSRQSSQYASPALSLVADAAGTPDPALLPNGPPTMIPAVRSRALAAFGRLPILFEPNVGQIDLAHAARRANHANPNPEVKFLARGAGYSLFLTPDRVEMSLRNRAAANSRSESLSMKLVGANPSARVEGADLLPGQSNYFIGNDSSQWRREIPQFARVRYQDVYPGINLVFYGNQGQLEYDFQVAPGSNPAQAELEFDGSRKLELNNGSLIVKGQGGDVRLEVPRAYQQIDGQQKPVESRFVLRAGNRVGFEVGAYDRRRELVIDPILTYSTYFGGSGDETCPTFVSGQTTTPGCPAIAIDNVADIYLVGTTTSPTGFPGTGALVPPSTASNIYVAKLDPTGSTLIYLAFLGGGGTDVNAGVQVDGSGNVYLAGTTSSGVNGTAPFPTTSTNSYQTVPATGSTGTAHVFVTELASSGSSLTYSSYLSGNGTDIASGMTIDSKDDILVTGSTTSTDQSAVDVNDQFPASSPPEAPPFQPISRATTQFFVTKVNTQAFGKASITYSTYFGGGVPGDGIAVGGGIAVDSSGNIYFSGTTNFIFTGQSPSNDFPILNAYQPCLDTAPPAVNTNPQSCATTSVTSSDAFVAKLNPNAPAGTGQLLWSTYFGGANDDSSTGIALDTGAANVYITGTTNSPTIVPVGTAIAFQAFQNCLDVYPNVPGTTACATPSGATDAYVAKLANVTAAIQTLGYFSYLGGSGNEAGLAIAVDSGNGALLTGYTQSGDFPVTPSPSPIQSNLKGPQDAFLARLNTNAVTGQTTGSYSTYFGGSGTDTGTSIVIDSNLNTYLAGITNSPDFPTAAPLQPHLAGGFDAFAAKFGTSADLAITGVLSLGTGQTYISAGNQATFTYTVTNNGPDLATGVTITDTISQTVTGVLVNFASATASSGTCSQPTGSTNSVPVVCTIPSLQAGATTTVVITLVPTAGGNFNGGAVIVSSTNNNDPVPSNNTTTVPAIASDFTVAVTPANQTVLAAGDTATYSVLLTPQPVYGSSVSLSCSAGVPSSGSTCSFQPSNTIPLTASPFAATLNITTTARPIPTASNKSWPGRIYAMWLAVPGIALVGLGAGSSRRRRRILGVLLVCLLFGLIVFQPGCSGASTPPVVAGTPPGTYNITLTATSGSDTKQSTFTLTVP